MNKTKLLMTYSPLCIGDGIFDEAIEKISCGGYSWRRAVGSVSSIFCLRNKEKLGTIACK